MKRPLRIMTLALLASAAIVGTADAARPRRPHPPHAPRHEGPHHRAASIDPESIREIRSELRADTQRAEGDLRVQLVKAVGDWLAEDGVPKTWTPPRRLVDRMIAGKVFVEPVRVKDLDVFRASVDAEFSNARKREFLETFRRQDGGRRLAYLGGGLAFLLACLAGISGYIRADEATKGYYTNRLRLLAAAGVGAAGVAVYQVMT